MGIVLEILVLMKRTAVNCLLRLPHLFFKKVILAPERSRKFFF